MRFSVLVSVYAKDNKEHFEGAIQSIIHQTLQPNEILIMVDGEIDKEVALTIKKLKKNYPHLINVHYLTRNVGLGEAMKIGVRLCKYDVIARMDSDDIAKSTRFEIQINYLKQNPRVDIVGSYISEFIEHPSNIVSDRKVPIKDIEIKKFAKRRSPFNHMTVIFKKEAILSAGNYQKFPFLEDYFLWIRLIHNDIIAHNIPESLVYARIGKEMFKRRGGRKYLSSEVKLQLIMYKMRFINIFELASNVMVRGIVRLLPNSLRGMLYQLFLRDRSHKSLIGKEVVSERRSI
ncbi:glycosyltransferase [Neobacillus drentensis]|uniref:glycosyltransferase n=1 Tax=Neobacillus drentensis TaxID=220684 RepID=UPI003000CB16